MILFSYIQGESKKVWLAASNMQNCTFLCNSPVWYFIHIFFTFFVLSIYKFGLSVCLSVCLYPINVKTAEPIGPKFCVGHLGTPGKVYESSKFQIFVSIKIRSSLNFLKFWKSTKFFWKSANYICFVLRCTQREHVHNLFRRWAQSTL